MVRTGTMAFTYNGTLTTDLDRVRFYLGDVTSGSGPLPGDANFTDAELSGLITAEGSWQCAVAAGYERLATSWRKFPSFMADGMQLQRSDIAKGFEDQAKEWRKKYGSGSTASSSRTGGAGSRAVTRVDGYSNDVTNQDR
jgi:hypothetical protein